MYFIVKPLHSGFVLLLPGELAERELRDQLEKNCLNIFVKYIVGSKKLFVLSGFSLF